MKKIVSIFLSAILLVSLCSCSALFGSSSQETVTLTIVYPDSSETVEVQCGRLGSITPKQASGQILVGYYGQETAVGTEYFDSNGQMNSKWKSTNPSTIYAVYEEADYSRVFTSETLREEDPYHSVYYKGTTYEFDSFCNFAGGTSEEQYYLQLLNSNPRADIRITVYADLKYGDQYNEPDEDPVEITVMVGKDSLASEEYMLSESSYRTVSISATIKAKQLIANDENVVKLNVEASTYTKNVYYTVSFVGQ